MATMSYHWSRHLHHASSTHPLGDYHLIRSADFFEGTIEIALADDGFAKVMIKQAKEWIDFVPTLIVNRRPDLEPGENGPI